MAEREFHPDDPTAYIWKKLLPSDTSHHSRGPMSAEERLRRSKANKAFWEDVPSITPPKGGPKGDLPVYGQCTECGNDIHDQRLAEIGMGPTCLRKAVETGRVVVENGEYVLRKKRRKRKNG